MEHQEFCVNEIKSTGNEIKSTSGSGYTAGFSVSPG
jgi:hypothetical protein